MVSSLHADVRCAMNQRSKLERLCRYITRPAIADKRLARNKNGQSLPPRRHKYLHKFARKMT
jgi:hypothetical protein